MLPLQFFGQNLHFVINLFAALVFFATFWLYFDAWTTKHDKKVLVKWVGFLLVAISYIAQSTVIESSVLGRSSLGNASEQLAAVLCMIGFAAIILGQLIDPLQTKPQLKGLQATDYKTKRSKAKTMPALLTSGLAGKLQWWLPPLGALAICALYWRRATSGLERHLKPVAVAFGLIFISRLLAMANLWYTSDNPTISKLVAPFGPLWITELVSILVGSMVLGRWVWQYLTKRLMSQLFMIFMSAILAIFVLTTVSFTYLLVNNIQKTSLDNLGTAASVLDYALNGKKAETLANIQATSENPNIINAVVLKDHDSLVSQTASYLHDKQLSTLIITSDVGQVLLRAENPDQYGDSLSSDGLIRRALIGQSSSGISIRDGILAPQIYIKSASPIRHNQVIGVAVGGLVIDNAFVDGIKQATGLDSSIYAGNVRSATTFVAPDGVARWIGVKETNSDVITTVIKKGLPFKGTLNIQNRPFLAVYTPVKDINNNVIGMLFIGQPQVDILRTARRSVELTFIMSAILLVTSIVPAYIASRYLTRQIN